MSVSNNLVYIKSQNDVININNNINLDGRYQFTLFPVNGRAVPVSKIDVNKTNNTVTFNDIIMYNGESNTVSIRTDYFSNSYSEARIYRNNLYESVMNNIKNIDLINDPTAFLMYGYTGEQTIVTSIVDAQTHYTFTSSLGSIDFDKNTGVPLRTTIGNDTSEELRFVVYKYDGYSHITTDYYNFVIDKLKGISNGFSYTDSSNNQFIKSLNVFIVHSLRKSEKQSHKIFRNYINTNINITYPLIFFSPYQDNNNNWSDEGVSFKLNNNNVSVPDSCINYIPDPFKWVLHGTAPCPYRIYRKNFFSNFSNISSIFTSQQAKDLIISYQPWIISPSNNFRLSYSPSTFFITNNKPTDRILVYQQGTNKLLHITDWIAKGTTQNVTINYTNNNGVLNVTSSVIPVNPLPVPQFIIDGNVSAAVGEDGGTFNLDLCTNNSIVNNIQVNHCRDNEVQGMYFNCRNPYSGKITEAPGKWRGDIEYGCDFYTKTKDSGFNGMYADAGRYVDKINFYGADGEIFETGQSRGKWYVTDYICPNGKITGFFTRGGGNLDKIQAYCASPKIT